MLSHFSTLQTGWASLTARFKSSARVAPTPPLPFPVAKPSRVTPPPVPLIRPSLSRLAQMDEAELPAFVRNSAIARKYLRLLGPLDWEHLPERDSHRPWPGPQPQPRAPFVAAFLVKLNEDKRYMSGLRDLLTENPALVWVLGFPLHPSDQFPWGFDVEASLPGPRQFGRVLRRLPNASLQFLLDGTVRLLADALPPEIRLGEAISLDTKHIVAWVRENNPKLHIKNRYDKTRQPKGDPDCRLGCKARHPKGGSDTDAPTRDSPASAPTAGGIPHTDPRPARQTEVGEFYWGYASGVVATKVPDWGEFVLAEWTQPFDQSDASYFFPLMKATERRLGHRPKFGALDTAYDAFYVYEYFYQPGSDGFAAVPLAERGGHKSRQFDAAGLPLCPAGLAMPLKSTFTDRHTLVEHLAGRYVCPLHFPQPTGQPCPCDDAHWAKGGCITTLPLSIGARLRYQLDRESPAFQRIYDQRTATERINSLAVELGIESPKLRNGAAIANLNTLIYVLLNLRALRRVRARRDSRVASVEESALTRHG